MKRANMPNMLLRARWTCWVRKSALPGRFKVRQGDAVELIKQTLAENPEIGALVLGAAIERIARAAGGAFCWR